MPDAQPQRRAAIVLGGARIGWLHLTWPLAVLRASAEGLELISVLGRRRFAPEDVVAVEPVTWFPLLAWGVSIAHVRSDVPERCIFWSIRPPASVMRAIERSGFVARGSASERTADDAPRDQPSVLRGQFLGAAVLVAGVIVALDQLLLPSVPPGQPSYAAVVLLALLFAASLLVRRRSGRFRRFAMTDPDGPPRHREVLNLVTAMSGLVLLEVVATLLGY